MNSKKIAREILNLSSKITDEKTLITTISLMIDVYAGKQAEKINDKSSFISEVRASFADYVKSEGCSCCRNTIKHDEAMEKLAALLEIEPYKDGSGFNVYKYATK